MDTGGEQSEQQTKQPRWGFRGKTVWNWLEVLIVPLVLVVIGLVFTMLQETRQQDLENQRAEQAQKLENQRAEAERELAVQRAQDEALQAYLDQMSTLMLDRKLLEAEQGDPVHTLAQARTSTIILSLDAEHNESVTRFLSDSGLAERSEDSPRILRGIALPRAALREADLRNADLREADLIKADLHDANLSNADLREADLLITDLHAASLSNADLHDADLFRADLHAAFLDKADLSNAFLPESNLADAYLAKADLSNAFLDKADLNGAEGVSNEELEKQVLSLEGATMPNGQKYEDWLKDR